MLRQELAGFVHRYGLSERESEVLEKLLMGTAQLESIASLLLVSRNTIRNHFQNIFQKTGTNSKAELLALFVRRALVLDNETSDQCWLPTPITMLFGDDDDDFLQFFRRGLRKCRFRGELYLCTSEEEIMAWVRQDAPGSDAPPPRPDLIVLGFDNAADLVGRIRAEVATPIVALLDSDVNVEVPRVYKAGASSLLRKPRHFSDLTQLVKVLELYWVDWSCLHGSPSGERNGRHL